MSRVSLFLLLACVFAVQPSWASQPDFRMQVVPAFVYKVDGPGSTLNVAEVRATDTVARAQRPDATLNFLP